MTSPVPLPVYGLNTSVPEAYNNISDGVDTVVIKQSNGLLVDAIYLPQLYAEQTGVNTYDESVSQTSAAKAAHSSHTAMLNFSQGAWVCGVRVLGNQKLLYCLAGG